MDFLLSRGKKIYPIEVKSSGYNTHKSLDKFCAKYSDRIDKRYLLYTKDLKKDGQTLLLPIYMTPLLWFPLQIGLMVYHFRYNVGYQTYLVLLTKYLLYHAKSFSAFSVTFACGNEKHFSFHEWTIIINKLKMFCQLQIATFWLYKVLVIWD